MDGSKFSLKVYVARRDHFGFQVDFEEDVQR
jgi:hypothetical protein